MWEDNAQLAEEWAKEILDVPSDATMEIEEIRRNQWDHCDRCGVWRDEAGGWWHRSVNPHDDRDKRFADKDYSLCYRCGEAYSEWGPHSLKKKNRHWEATGDYKCCDKAVYYGDHRNQYMKHWHCENEACGRNWNLERKW